MAENEWKASERKRESTNDIIVISDGDDDDDFLAEILAFESKQVKISTEDHLIEEDQQSVSQKKIKYSSDHMKVNPGMLTVLSWNLDGLEGKSLGERTQAAIRIILKKRPDVVFLQEVVYESRLMLLAKCSVAYEIQSNDGGYFNAILIKKDKNLKICGELQIVRFPNTAMERHYILQKISVFGHLFTLITTHLESLKDYAVQRQNQLKTCFDIMLNQQIEHNAIFAGDLNLREAELKKIGGIPNSLSDAWESAGSKNDVKFTWDLKRNDNKQFEWGKPQARYDRMYFKRAKSNPIQCVDFQLLGTERISSCEMFPSDHFGILVNFVIPL